MLLPKEKGWQKALEEEFSKPYFEKLGTFIEKEYQQTLCFPEKSKIFAAFDFCAWENLKVVILGQDPYHSVNQANGLCFSVLDGVAHPPSLVNILKEIKTDIGNSIIESGDLSPWAQQGVLLLNATLTVKQHEAGSHQKMGWEVFTDAVIQKISEQKEHIVFLLWGNFAKKKGKWIDADKHYILTTGHPSPMSANRGLWFGNQHFSKANLYLKKQGLKEINW